MCNSKLVLNGNPPIRLCLQVDRLQKFLRNWAKRRVKVDDPAWQNGVRVGGPKYGVPRTSMPVSGTTSNLGVTLSFDGSPTDLINLEVLYLR